MKLIIVTTCKPFTDSKTNLIQEQAIKSWLNLRNFKNSNVDIKKIDIKIIIVGDEKGVKEICNKYNIINRIDYKKFLVFPYISSMLEIANEYADNNDIIMWTNSDIIYTKSLLKTIIEFKKFKIKDYLLVGQRLDWEKYKEIELNKKNLIEIINNSKFHVPCGIDYFIHSKTSLLNNFDKKLSMPAICGDQKLLNSGIKKNIFTCDCTQTILAIHQDLGRENRESDYFKKVKKNNLECKGGWSNIKQCKFISFYYNKEIKFKLRRDINWYENRLNENFKKQIKFLEKKIKKILILNL